MLLIDITMYYYGYCGLLWIITVYYGFDDIYFVIKKKYIFIPNIHFKHSSLICFHLKK